MGTIANAKVTHYYNCYNGDFIGCLQFDATITYFECGLMSEKFYKFNLEKIWK